VQQNTSGLAAVPGVAGVAESAVGGAADEPGSIARAMRVMVGRMVRVIIVAIGFGSGGC